MVMARPERVQGPVGEALGVGIGQSIEFMDFREYEPGNDTRQVDWAVYARTDRLMVRRHREDVSPWMDLVVDGSRSMDLPGTPKADVALAIAAACHRGASRAGYRVSPWRTAEGGAIAPAALDRWNGFNEIASNPLGDPPRRRGAATGGVRVVVSDLLCPGDLGVRIRAASAGVRWLVIMHVLAKDDLRAPMPGPTRLEDRETGAECDLHIDAEVAGAFDARVRRYLESCRSACTAVRATYVRMIAEEVWDDGSLLAPLVRAGVFRTR